MATGAQLCCTIGCLISTLVHTRVGRTHGLRITSLESALSPTLQVIQVDVYVAVCVKYVVA